MTARSYAASSSAGLTTPHGLFGVAGVRGPLEQFAGRDGGGELADACGVGMVDGDEGLGAGGVHPGEQIVLGVMDDFGGEWDAGVVAFEFDGLGCGGVDPGAEPRP